MLVIKLDFMHPEIMTHMTPHPLDAKTVCNVTFLRKDIASASNKVGSIKGNFSFRNNELLFPINAWSIR